VLIKNMDKQTRQTDGQSDSYIPSKTLVARGINTIWSGRRVKVQIEHFFTPRNVLSFKLIA